MVVLNKSFLFSTLFGEDFQLYSYFSDGHELELLECTLTKAKIIPLIPYRDYVHIPL